MNKIKIALSFFISYLEDLRTEYRRYRGWTDANAVLQARGYAAEMDLQEQVSAAIREGRYTDYEAGIETALRDWRMLYKS